LVFESSGRFLHGYLLIFPWSEEKERACDPVAVYWFEKVIKNANEIIYVVCTEIKIKI